MAKPVICWDSVVLISWITEEHPNRLPGIAEVIKGIANGRYALAVSGMFFEEVKQAKMLSAEKARFSKFMLNHKNITPIPTNSAIHHKAQAIAKATTIKPKDAIHVATAIAVDAKVLHTYDNGILKYNTRAEVDSLAIEKCAVPIPAE